MIIREIQTEDARRFLELCKQTDSESDFLLFEKNERSTTVEEQRKSIESFIRSNNGTIFVVEDEHELVGYLLARGGSARKNQHSVYIVIAILQSHTGKGLGTALFKRLEEWAQEKGIRRLELGVMAPNVHALSLYKKMGFEIEGKKLNVFFMDGTYIDEYMMAKMLES